jgi:putative DNA-invertase from lambdoid prophage Rac
MAHLAYFRVSTVEQSIESQRAALLKSAGVENFREFKDEGVSGSVLAVDRPGFKRLLDRAEEGDVIHVYAVDRLGRNSIDIQTTVRDLLERGVAIEVHGLGRIAAGVGELIVGVLAQVADMERKKILQRTTDGRVLARESLAAKGKTHKGKDGLGRPLGSVGKDGKGRMVKLADVVAWRKANGKDSNSASISETATHFGVSESTVKRYCLVEAQVA